MKNKQSRQLDQNSQEPKKYSSIVDEFHRHKRIIKKFHFYKISTDDLWNAFLIAFQKTFKIKQELSLDLEFGLKVQSIYTKYQITTYQPDQQVLQIDWKNGHDQYWMKFKIRKTIFKNHLLKITQHIYKSTPFWGLQDIAGIWLFKKNFKKQMKQFVKGMKLIINNQIDLNETDFKN